VRIIVVGSGVAGLYFAIKARSRGHDVIVLTKDELEGSSWKAQGGIAVPLDDNDLRIHVRDTLVAGRGLAHEPVVWAYVGLIRHVIRDLMGMGVRFNVRTREGGHSRARVLGINDHVGRGIMSTLSSVSKELGVTVINGFSLGEIVVRNKRAVGVTSLDGEEYLGDAVVLATGGYAGIFRFRTNDNLGEGIEAAARVGCLLRDLEFVQFHPTVTYDGFLITEAVRGEGGVLINARGERFMYKYDPAAELAPRDVVARAVYMEMTQGPVYLDARSIRNFPERFPTIYAYLRSRGIDPLRDPIPVTPGAHYTIGGVAVDALGRSTLRGLFVIGEASSSMFHGANRLASNSILEALVQGYLASRAIEAYYSSGIWGNLALDFIEVDCGLGGDELGIEELRRIMWNHVGVVRDHRGLVSALKLLSQYRGPGVLISLLVTRAALLRKGSVGVHYRLDDSGEQWNGHIVMRCSG